MAQEQVKEAEIAAIARMLSDDFLPSCSDERCSCVGAQERFECVLGATPEAIATAAHDTAAKVREAAGKREK